MNNLAWNVKWHVADWWRRSSERLVMGIAWHLPRELAYWCAVRVGAHATGGKWGDTHPGEVSMMDMLQRWKEPN